MSKTHARLPLMIAAAALVAAPVMARETRSSQSITPAAQSVTPPGRSNGSEVSQERLALLFDVAAGACDAPGNGNKTGHENGQGRGHEIGRGKGHACDGKSPG